MAEILFFALAISLSLVAIVAALARWRPSGWAACAAAALASVLACGVFSWSLLVQGLLTFAWSALCGARGWKPRAHLAGAATAAVIGLVFATAIGLAAVREQRRLREEYAVESLAPRLAYETRADRPPPALVGSDSPHYADVERFLTSMDERRDSGMRGYMLRRLHERTRDDFVFAAGFGETRMMRVRSQYLELPPDELERLECPADANEPGGTEANEPQVPPLLAGPPPDDLRTMHFDGLDQLFDGRWLGYVAGKQQAAGFASHRFVVVPSLPAPSAATTTWQVVRLELVSLLKYDRPLVYASTELPRMDALDEMPRRELVEFEAAALERLRLGEDVVFDTAGNQIQMLGSLRAARDCLDCHTAQRGELLGALSYELLPAAVGAEESP